MSMDNAWFEQRFRGAYKKTSADSYVARMKALVNKSGADFWDIMTRPTAWWPPIRDVHYADSVGTRRAIATMILAAFKLLPHELRRAHDGAQRRWLSINKSAALVHVAVRHDKTEREKANWVTLAEIRAKVTELAKTCWNRSPRYSLQFVLFSIYATTPPPRSDLGAMKVHDTDPLSSEGNYIVVPEEGPAYFVFNRFKTADNCVTKKQKRGVTSQLTPETTATIRESVRAHPREYLFVNRDGRPFATNHAYGLFVRRTFKNNFGGRAAGTSLLRHVYITESGMWNDEVDPDVRADIHRRMMHTLEAADGYRKRVSRPI